MSDEFVIEPRWARWRYLFDDGECMDVRSPYRSDSTDRERVLVEAERRWGKRDGRRIEGVARIEGDDPQASIGPKKKSSRVTP